MTPKTFRNHVAASCGYTEPSKAKLQQGTPVMCNGYRGAIVRHYDGATYEVRVPGGVVATDQFTVIPSKAWRHPITGETREEIHAKRTKYTPQIGPSYCPNCGRKLSDCNGNCIFSKAQIPAEALDQMQRESWASIESQRKYWETRDHGRNVLPDRIQANHDQSEERVCDGEDVEEWQHQSEQQGAE